MTYVPVKSAEQQADGRALSVRELLIRQRTQMVNALRGHATEFGDVAGKGLTNVEGLARGTHLGQRSSCRTYRPDT